MKVYTCCFHDALQNLFQKILIKETKKPFEWLFRFETYMILFVHCIFLEESMKSPLFPYSFVQQK